MNKNEAINFGKQYRSSICLNKNLRPVKVIECLEQDGLMYFALLDEQGTRTNVPCTEILIPLKGRLRNRDYDFVQAEFHKK